MSRVLSLLDDLLLVVVLGAGSWFGYQAVRPDRPAPPVRPPALVEEAESPTLRTLETLDVKGRAPRTGYDRKLFGVGSVDLDRNGCDVRNDVLRRDLTDLVFKPGTGDCKVQHGRLDDPYTGWQVELADVEIDHVVALSDAWQKGAQQLSPEERVRFGNDPRNLLAVSAQLNRQKGAADAATWLPPNKDFRCEYVTTQVEVKAAYGLWLTAAEREVMAHILRSCPPAGPTPRSPTRSGTTTSDS